MWPIRFVRKHDSRHYYAQISLTPNALGPIHFTHELAPASILLSLATDPNAYWACFETKIEISLSYINCFSSLRFPGYSSRFRYLDCELLPYNCIAPIHSLARTGAITRPRRAAPAGVPARSCDRPMYMDQIEWETRRRLFLPPPWAPFLGACCKVARTSLGGGSPSRIAITAPPLYPQNTMVLTALLRRYAPCHLVIQIRPFSVYPLFRNQTFPEM